MLVLTRRIGETVKIGEDIEVTVLGHKGGQIRLGIAAPKNVDVHRQEIWQRIQDEKAKGKQRPAEAAMCRDDLYSPKEIREMLVPALHKAFRK